VTREALVCIFWAVVAIVPWQTAKAQATQDQFLPEIDAYWTVNPDMRVEVLASRTQDGSSYDSATFGSGVDFFVKRLSSKLRTNEDDANQKLLTLGVTYRSISNVDKPDENRLQFDVTPRYSLLWDMLLGDRNRIELRIISGGVTWRYRNRLTVQRTFKLHRFTLTPYARGEAFYDISKGMWSETTYSFGGFIPLTKRMEIQPYFQHENMLGSSSPNVNAFGLTFSVYFRKSAAKKDKK
jgi:hypothetical protein